VFLFSRLQCLWCLRILQKRLLLTHAKMIVHNCFEVKLCPVLFYVIVLTASSDKIPVSVTSPRRCWSSLANGDIRALKMTLNSLTNLKPRGLLQSQIITLNSKLLKVQQSSSELPQKCVLIASLTRCVFPCRWFHQGPNPYTGTQDWLYSGNYWDRNYFNLPDIY